MATPSGLNVRFTEMCRTTSQVGGEGTLFSLLAGRLNGIAFDGKPKASRFEKRDAFGLPLNDSLTLTLSTQSVPQNDAVKLVVSSLQLVVQPEILLLELVVLSLGNKKSVMIRVF